MLQEISHDANGRGVYQGRLDGTASKHEASENVGELG